MSRILVLIIFLKLNIKLNYCQNLNQKYRENIPRFRIAHIPRHEVFLGDRVLLNCNAVSQTRAIIEWYRNDKPLTSTNTDFSRIFKDNRNMQLDIHQIDVSDQGMWSCKVQNSYGHVSRNFTIEIIDFCDYFLIPIIASNQIPMECVCLWKFTRETRRIDIDFRMATVENCKKYESRMIRQAKRPFSSTLCWDPPCNNTQKPFSLFMPVTRTVTKLVETTQAPSVTRVTLTTDNQQLANENSGRIKPITQREKTSTELVEKEGTEKVADEVEEEEDTEDEFPPQNPISPDMGLVEINITSREAPYFKNIDQSILNETHALPAGRTLKLNCRAYGNPIPKIAWFKNGILLTKKSSRTGGYEYKFKRWTLELEDVMVADGGTFHCEAWNEIGLVSKYFTVVIVNRMRRPPIIVPNILKNQSVNVNDTAKFNCKVVSDLLPHIMWVRINKVNGSYHYYNQSAGEYMFNYTEMDAIENAHVHHFGDESSLTLYNVSLEDQGVYACLTGNSLGMTMDNASLTVNDFVSIHLLTGDDPSVKKIDTATILILVLLLLLLIMFSLISIYLILYKLRLKRKKLDENVQLLPKKKRVVVNKKHPIEDKEGGCSDIPTYQIQIIEQTITSKDAGKRKRKRINSENTVLSEYEVESDPNWEINREKLKLIHMLGEGAFGEVWKASLSDENSEGGEKCVAVKKLKISAHEKELIDLVSEMETFKIIGEHENLLRLVGCCTGSGPLYVVLELCRHGNLRDFLRAHRPIEDKAKKSNQDLTDYLEPIKGSTSREDNDLIPHLTQRHLVCFAWQVARGMDFMAKKKIIHRDLAARNVLVADNHVLKISDFGLSRDVHCNDYYRKRGNGRLPIKWMALEALDSHMYTIESDVWSFGILLWEIMTLGGTPYPTIAMPELYATLKEGYRMEAPHNCPDEVYNIMVACWQEKRENRPSFATIVDYLDWMLVESADVENGPEDRNKSEPIGISPLSNTSSSFANNKKHRPLSAPVNLPSEPQYDICDDEPEIEGSQELYHFYCNDNVFQDCQRKSSESMNSGANQKSDIIGYVKNNSVVCVVGNVANNSLDSAVDSPPWHSCDRASNNNLKNASCLEQFHRPHEYYNINGNIRYTCIEFNEINRSCDSAICEEPIYYLYPNYAKIIKQKRPLSTSHNKETIV